MDYDLNAYIQKYILPFSENLTGEHTYYNHIEYLGCGHIRAGDYGNLESLWQLNYGTFFQNGFTNEEFETEINSPKEKYMGLFMPCMHDNAKFQLNALNEDVLANQILELKLTEPEAANLKRVYSKWTKSQEEIRDYMLNKNPGLDKVFNVWNNSSIKRIELTTVGVAVAHANYRRRTGDKMDLSIWIK